MGADMSGYLLKGPKKLPKNAAKLAVQALKEQRQELIEGVLKCGNCGDVLEDGETCYCGWPVVQAKTTDEDINDLAKELVKEWVPEYRDCSSRIDPDDKQQVIVFAGDMSWGEEPDGAGFTYLKKLCLSGVATALKIR